VRSRLPEALQLFASQPDGIGHASLHLSTQAAKTAITETRKRGYNVPKRGRVK
jgi:hypothetical protein